MKVYILTLCCGAGDYTPTTFANLEDAKKRLKECYDYELERDKKFGGCITDSEIYDRSYTINYCDDTFVKATIYDVEVK